MRAASGIGSSGGNNRDAVSRDAFLVPTGSRYRPVEQATWARERLLGVSSSDALLARDPELQKRVEEADRLRALQALCWHAQPQPVVEVEAVDRLEMTFKQRLGLLSSSSWAALGPLLCCS